MQTEVLLQLAQVAGQSVHSLLILSGNCFGGHVVVQDCVTLLA